MVAVILSLVIVIISLGKKTLTPAPTPVVIERIIERTVKDTASEDKQVTEPASETPATTKQTEEEDLDATEPSYPAFERYGIKPKEAKYYE